MDTTPLDSMLRALEDADPAEAPDLADAVARVLGDWLDPGRRAEAVS
jgi:hypothetical protein